MQIQIESTADIVTLDGVQCRRWKGVTSRGTECEVLVHRIAVREDLDSTQFEQELAEQLPPGRPFIDWSHVI
jgi:hypothetical protein